MKYEIKSNEYEHTGGNIWCLFSEIYINDERRTVYAITGEDVCNLFGSKEAFDEATDPDFTYWYDDDVNGEGRYLSLACELIEEFKRCENERHGNNYLAKLKDFRKYMTTCFDILMGDECDGGTVDNFYRSDFEIKWRGKTIVLHNGAEVFQGIEEIIQTEIDNEEV